MINPNTILKLFPRVVHWIKDLFYEIWIEFYYENGELKEKKRIFKKEFFWK